MEQEHKDKDKAKQYPTLGPTYFSAKDFCDNIEVHGKFDGLARDFVEMVYDQLLPKFEYHLMDDARTNIAAFVRREVDECVKSIILGEEWAINRYALTDRYESSKVRAAIAAHVPEQLLTARINDLEAEVKRLKEARGNG